MRQRELAGRACVPCQEGTPPLKGADLTELHDQIDNGLSHSKIPLADACCGQCGTVPACGSGRASPRVA